MALDEMGNPCNVNPREKKKGLVLGPNKITNGKLVKAHHKRLRAEKRIYKEPSIFDRIRSLPE